MPLEKIADQAQQYLMEFQQIRSKPTSKKLPKKIIWKPLDPGTSKTNFDGAVFEDLGAAGIGVVVRNSFGTIMATLSVHHQYWHWKLLQLKGQSISSKNLIYMVLF